MLISRPLLFPSKGGRGRAFSTECQIDQANFTDWMSFLSSNFMDDISPNSQRRNLKLLISMKQMKRKKRFTYKWFDIANWISYLKHEKKTHLVLGKNQMKTILSFTLIH